MTSAPGTTRSRASTEPLFIAIDSSTTACKVLVFDRHGTSVAEGRAGHALDNPEPDAYEQDATTWWTALCVATHSAMTQLSSEQHANLSALAVTHQRETVVVTDHSGEPLHPALVWMDARAHRQVTASIEKLGAEALHRISGKPACVTPSLFKLLYLFEEKAPDLRRQLPWVFDVHGFLVQRLTGQRVTSLGSADPLGLIDMAAHDWSPTLLELAGLERHQLPRLVEPGARIGTITRAAAEASGLPVGLPVIAGAGDGQCAGLGAGISGVGPAYLNLGTAIVSGVLSTRYVIDPAFRTLYAATPGSYFLETDLKGGTFTLDWFIEGFGAGQGASKTERLKSLEADARLLQPGSDGLLLVPYLCGVMNPYWDDAASGITLGWRGTHCAAHFYRAILEGIAFEQHLHTRGVEKATGSTVTEFIVMGGGSQSDLWCQILADVTQKPVVRSATREVTALGAAMLAAVAMRHHPDFDRAREAMAHSTARFTPSPSSAFYQALFSDVYEPIYPAMRTILSKLAELRRRAAIP